MKLRGFLISYEIDRLYFTVVLFLLLSFPLYATDWYVNKNANGSNNGTSWTNAWQLFSAINWSVIKPGDFLYISGGIDSLVYEETLSPACSGTASNYVTIIAGKYSPAPSGHSGRVIIDGGETQHGITFFDRGGDKPSYVKIKGFETKRVESGVYANMDVLHKCIVLDSLSVYGFKSPGIKFETGETGYQNADSIFIQNCRIVSPEYINGQSDGIQLKGVSHIFIDRNYIRIPNQQDTAHVDALQGYLVNGGIITNNIFINDSVYSPEGGGMPIIYGAEGALPVIIYNNFCYMGGVWYPGGNWGGTLMTRWYNHNPMPATYIIHNTVVSNGPRTRGVWLEFATPTTTVVVNNIIAQFSTTSSGVISTFDNSTNATLQVDNIRHNLFYQSWSNDVTFAGNVTGNGRTGTPTGWNDFVNEYGGTGVKEDPLLVSNIGHEQDQGTLNGELQSDSPALDQGEDIRWLLNYLNSTYGLNGRLGWEDINGNIRDNTPDIGAYQYSSVEDSTFSFSLSTTQGYNLVSVPGINPDGMGVNTWWAYRDMNANIFKYSNGYHSVTTTIPGEGYWMKQLGIRTYNTGDEWPATGILKVAHNPINCNAGWNLIGGYESSINTSSFTTNPPELIVGPFFKYSRGFFPSSTINPGSGYWMKMLGPGQMIIPDSFMKEEEENDLFPDDWGRIIITDANDASYTLYAVKGEVDLSYYELPPAPMEGLYDFRFSSGRIAENLENGGQTVEMSGIYFPVRVKVENMNITLQDENGMGLDAILNNGEELTIINNSIDRLRIISSHILNPVKYSLEQNYPNPFNPKTIIEFSIPEETNVTLKIYNLLGEKITELVNEKLKAGNYSYTWNAQSIATGVYIYELNTDKYSSFKKMVLLR
jgi:hypothetical protein